jgi:hypothetical protein
MQAIMEILSTIDPLWVITTIVVGFLIGHMSKEIHFEKKSIFLLAYFILPFISARIIAFLLMGEALVLGAGFIGSVFLILYGIVFVIGRKI